MAQAYCIFHCSSKELQARAGFDGWVLLLRDEFDTEDQAWAQERQRLATMVKRKMRRLESGGAELDMLQLVTSSHLLLDPPSEDREEERIWCIEFFRGKMYDFVVRAVPASASPARLVLAPVGRPCSACSHSPSSLASPAREAATSARCEERLPIFCRLSIFRLLFRVPVARRRAA